MFSTLIYARQGELTNILEPKKEDMDLILGICARANNKDAGVGYPNKVVWEEWPYPTGTWLDYPKHVSEASGQYELLWQFNKDSANTFQITITAWVNWGEVVMTPGSQIYGTPDKYNLVDRGWTSNSITFTVNA